MTEEPMKAVLHYAQALEAPRIRDSAARLGEQARDAGWTHEEYLAAVNRPGMSGDSDVPRVGWSRFV